MSFFPPKSNDYHMTHSIVYSCFENATLVKIMKLCYVFKTRFQMECVQNMQKQNFKLSVYEICNNKCVTKISPFF